jgi:hypothetical protein
MAQHQYAKIRIYIFLNLHLIMFVFHFKPLQKQWLPNVARTVLACFFADYAREEIDPNFNGMF